MSMFTRRQYIWLTSVARDMKSQITLTTDSLVAREAVASAIGTLATALEDESAYFDKKRFLKAVFGDPTAHPPSSDPETPSSRL